MRHLELKDFKNPPSVLLKNLCHRQTNTAFENKEGNKYNGHYYGDNEVKTLLRAYSLGKNTIETTESAKCYYCESKIEHATSLQVEHYRPKGKVDKKDTNNIEHKGYYWLGNEWTNLLLSCPKCNGKSAKGNRFPIAGIRAVAHNPITITTIKRKTTYNLDRTQLFATKLPLINEEPILLNPEIDNPKDFLSFENDGQIKGIDLNERGKITAEILDLNREKLQSNRQAILNNFLNDLNVIASNFKYIQKEGLVNILKYKCRKIIKAQEISEEYSLFGKYINDNFEECIVNKYSDSFKGNLLEAYKSVSM